MPAAAEEEPVRWAELLRAGRPMRCRVATRTWNAKRPNEIGGSAQPELRTGDGAPEKTRRNRTPNEISTRLVRRSCFRRNHPAARQRLLTRRIPEPHAGQAGAPVDRRTKNPS